MKSAIFLTMVGFIGIYVAGSNAKTIPADDETDSRLTEETARDEEGTPEQRDDGKCNNNMFNLSGVV